MLNLDKGTLKGICYIVSIPLGIIAFNAFIFSLPYLGMLVFSFLFANMFMYWLNI